MAFVASGDLNMGTALGLGPMNRQNINPQTGGAPGPANLGQRGGAPINNLRRENRNIAIPSPPPPAAIDETELYIVVTYGQGGSQSAIIHLLGNLCMSFVYKHPLTSFTRL